MCNSTMEFLHIRAGKPTCHPAGPGWPPKKDCKNHKITAKDRALNLIAEQSIEMYDELKRLKTFIKESFENISNVIKNNSRDIEQIIDNKSDPGLLPVLSKPT